MATARSGSASPLKSPTATDDGAGAGGEVGRRGRSSRRRRRAAPRRCRSRSWRPPGRGRSRRRSRPPRPSTGSSPTAKLVGGAEAPAAVAEQHRDVVGVAVGDRQVGVGVAVEVAHRDRERAVADGEVGRRAEAPAAVAEQHRDVVGAVVGDRQVGVGVAVEVAHRDREGLVAGGEVGRGAEAHLRQRPRRQRQRHHRHHHRRTGQRADPPSAPHLGSAPGRRGVGPDLVRLLGVGGQHGAISPWLLGKSQLLVAGYGLPKGDHDPLTFR